MNSLKQYAYTLEKVEDDYSLLTMGDSSWLRWCKDTHMAWGERSKIHSLVVCTNSRRRYIEYAECVNREPRLKTGRDLKMKSRENKSY